MEISFSSQASGTTLQCFPITVMDDASPEGDETILFSFTGLSGMSGSTTVVIIDNDGKINFPQLLAMNMPGFIAST